MIQSFNYKSALLLAIIPIVMVCDGFAIAKRNVEQRGRYSVKSVRLAGGWRRYSSRYGYQVELPNILESSGCQKPNTELYDAKNDTLLTKIHIDVFCSAMDEVTNPQQLGGEFQDELTMLNANDCKVTYEDSAINFYVIHYTEHEEPGLPEPRLSYVKGILRNKHFYQLTLTYDRKRQVLVDSISPRIFASFH